MLSVQNLEKSFRKNSVLKGVSLDISKPGILTVLGPNGSGKTTLIKCILGMVLPDCGQILFGGQSIANQWKYREQIGYLPQIARFPENLTVAELLRMIRDIRPNCSREEEMIRLFGLQPALNSRLGTLSGGTKQKVNLLLTFMYDNPVIILDEPTAGLDPVAMINLKDLIYAEKARGKIILITTHVMSLVEEMADEVVFLLEGHIHFRGTVPALKQRCGEEDLERAIAKLLKGECIAIGDTNIVQRAGHPVSAAFQ